MAEPELVPQNAGGSAGEKALGGEWEQISRGIIDIKEDMKMRFQGVSCNIFDGEGNVIDSISAEDGEVTKDVRAGCRCYVMRAKVIFEK